MMKTKKYIWLLLVVVLIQSCSYDFPPGLSYSAEDFGEIDMENVIAFGDGFLAGVMDGALYSEGQKNSIPAIVASQINRVDSISFVQPNVNSENGFNFYVSNDNEIYGKWIYQFSDKTSEKPQMILTQGQTVQDYAGDKSGLNNLAVPEISVQQLENGITLNDPYIQRIFGTSTNLAELIVQKDPTFIICWLGMDDFLKYAMNGALNSEDFTETETFRSNFELLIEKIIADSNSKMVMGNLMSINDLPYFYYKTYDKLFLEGIKLGRARSRYTEWNQAVAIYNRTVPEEYQRPFIDFFDNGSKPHSQPMVVIDDSLSDAFYPDGRPLEKFRQLSEDEMVLNNLTDEMIENGFCWLYPLEKRYYLRKTEIENINNRMDAFNSIIQEMELKYPDKITVADVKSKVHMIAETGKTDAWGEPINNEVIYYNGVPVEGSLNINSVFSLDGIHFNQRGNAYVANIFINAINSGFNANIPNVDINQYLGNTYHPNF